MWKNKSITHWLYEHNALQVIELSYFCACAAALHISPSRTITIIGFHRHQIWNAYQIIVNVLTFPIVVHKRNHTFFRLFTHSCSVCLPTAANNIKRITNYA